MDSKFKGITHVTTRWKGKRVEARRGFPLPLGVSETPEGINFAVFSRNATEVRLVVEGPDGAVWTDYALHPLFNRTGDVWHVLLPLPPSTLRYRFHVDGPAGKGHRFDEKTPLIEPHARGVLKTDQGWRAVHAPGVFDWGADAPLRTPVERTVIYELHVGGFTRDPSAGAEHPGTFDGVVEKIPHLQRLGVTAVELMPVAAFDDETPVGTDPLTGAPLKDFWGYNSLAFFAPHRGFSRGKQAGSPVVEFRRMVKKLHEAGIEVILDIVFNHSGEKDESGPTVSFRGLDNAVYYLLDGEGRYRDFTGCGNTLNCNHPVFRNLIRDCLRFWVTEMHVDGFRFDLASILGRGTDGKPLPNPPVIEEIGQDPVLAGVKIIAEAWDAAGLYQVGTFPRYGRWGEWNGRFRDDVRRFVRGDPGTIPALAQRLAGSPDLYGEGEGTCPSVNFVTCHDGFTLADLVRYDRKHNEANGEEGRDGAEENFSWNCGVEGPSGEADVLALRRRQVRNFLAILLLARGVPMLRAGDEFGNSQGGNNNPWCRDDPTGWIDWTPEPEGEGLLRFLYEMLRFRASSQALLRGDVSFHGVKAGQPDFSHASRSLAVQFHGEDGAGDVYASFNAWEEPLEFALPVGRWKRVADTHVAPPADIASEGEETPVEGDRIRVMPFSAVVLAS